mmetsp:Transcript_23622/g.29101  ORF Transcript_23622/g.29101 Transcript_23622/m.29101 type:complete len:318 (-) Transcript_23622:1096-2049(-)
MKLKRKELEKLHSPPPPNAPQIGFPGEGDLNEWSHHHGPETVDDFVLRKAGKGLVTFAYGQVIDGAIMSENDLQEKPKKEKKQEKHVKTPYKGVKETAPVAVGSEKGKAKVSSTHKKEKGRSVKVKENETERFSPDEDSKTCTKKQDTASTKGKQSQALEEVACLDLEDEDFVLRHNNSQTCTSVGITTPGISLKLATQPPQPSSTESNATSIQRYHPTPSSLVKDKRSDTNINQVTDKPLDQDQDLIWDCGDANQIFKELWPIKKKEKWKCVPGSGLYNYYYLAPGVKKKAGILNYNMFGEIETLVNHWRNNPNEL